MTLHAAGADRPAGPGRTRGPATACGCRSPTRPARRSPTVRLARARGRSPPTSSPPPAATRCPTSTGTGRRRRRRRPGRHRDARRRRPGPTARGVGRTRTCAAASPPAAWPTPGPGAGRRSGTAPGRASRPRPPSALLAPLQQLAGRRGARRRPAGRAHPRGGRRRHDEDVTDLAAAAVWGLVRSAQAENPDRLVLVDLDRPGRATPAALAAASPPASRRLAVRDGTVRGAPARPRTPPPARAPAPPARPPTAPCWSPAAPAPSARWSPGTWSPRTACGTCCWSAAAGPAPPGAADAGRRAGRRRARRSTVAACDVADRDALAALLAGDPGRAPADRGGARRRGARRRRRRVADPGAGSTRCCGPRWTPPGTCTS